MLHKQILVAVAIVTLIGSFAFAGGQQDAAEDDGVITLEVLHYLDLADNTSSGNFEELVDAFHAANPDIRLEFDYLFNEPYHNKLQSSAIAGQLPDAVFLWPGKRTGEVTSSGAVKDLSPWVDGVRDEFAPAALSPQGPNGEIWELPEQVTATHVMFANERLLDELGLEFPRTLEELLEQGEIIREAGYIPIAMDNADGWQMQSTLLSALVERTAGREWFDRAVEGEASFSDPEFVSAVEVIQTLHEEEMFSPGINQASYGEALTDFVTEEAVYLIDGGWRTSNLTGEMTEDQYEYVSYNVFPELPNEQGQAGSTAIVAGTGFGMNAELEGEMADAAWEWIYFFAGPEGSRIKAEQGWLPAVDIELPDDSPELTLKLADFLNSTPGGYVIDAVMDAEGMGVLHPLLQEMMFGNVTPQEVGNRYEEWVENNDSGRS
ncbi:MAG TPA: extracellular solute-binding protein [Alkalispirochaeta sp.]|nr:extracellular solute-binding protein [Alkalispirochaeta sp.]